MLCYVHVSAPLGSIQSQQRSEVTIFYFLRYKFISLFYPSLVNPGGKVFQLKYCTHFPSPDIKTKIR